MRDTLFPPYNKPGTLQRTIFPALASISLLAELLFGVMGQAGANKLDIFFLIVLAALFALAGWIAPLGEIAYLIVCFPLLTSGHAMGGILATLGLYAIATTWLVRSWFIPAGILLLVTLISHIFLGSTGDNDSLILPAIFGSFVTIVIGLIFRHQVQRRKIAEKERAEAQKASDRIRHDLATQLHATTAKDLARISILAQDLADQHPELDDKLRTLASIATSASQRIRPIILNLDSGNSDPDINEAMTLSQQMLTTRNIELLVDIPEILSDSLTPEQSNLASLIIREASTNILKYAPSNSTASLTVENAGNSGMSITLSNVIDSERHNTSLSGGFGLANLESKVKDAGGSMEVTHIDNRWILYAFLPSTATDKDRQ